MRNVSAVHFTHGSVQLKMCTRLPYFISSSRNPSSAANIIVCYSVFFFYSLVFFFTEEDNAHPGREIDFDFLRADLLVLVAAEAVLASIAILFLIIGLLSLNLYKFQRQTYSKLVNNEVTNIRMSESGEMDESYGHNRLLAYYKYPHRKCLIFLESILRYLR